VQGDAGIHQLVRVDQREHGATRIAHDRTIARARADRHGAVVTPALQRDQRAAEVRRAQVPEPMSRRAARSSADWQLADDQIVAS
jgi:hypothetical protein